MDEGAARALAPLEGEARRVAEEERVHGRYEAHLSVRGRLPAEVGSPVDDREHREPDPGEIRVITSYSIHYTKLYEVADLLGLSFGYFNLRIANQGLPTHSVPHLRPASCPA